jgi:hypothetical protein
MNSVEALNPETLARQLAHATSPAWASAHYSLRGKDRSLVRSILEIGVLALVMMAFLFPLSVVLNVRPMAVAERGSLPQTDASAKSAYSTNNHFSPRSSP